MSKLTEGRQRYMRNYILKKYKVIHLSFDKEKDKELLEHLNGKKNRVAYIRELITRDLNGC